MRRERVVVPLLLVSDDTVLEYANHHLNANEEQHDVAEPDMRQSQPGWARDEREGRTLGNSEECLTLRGVGPNGEDVAGADAKNATKLKRGVQFAPRGPADNPLTRKSIVVEPPEPK
eukprot:TRINITY_DN20380_c0_g1_i1.p2 TRINITY_DN20380_c0_g1~~TRINITY_DN20380_c0_g1_i1.p2  ORF type:complete len:117 (-),score=9.08 TRINITY_DN20380_c0_g1_i1:300-650(-)